MDERRKRIFISYKRDIDPDQSLAMELHGDLSRDCQVFIDQQLPVGSNWAECINMELQRCDYLIILLSASSVGSEMVLGEVEQAIQIAKQRQGRPMLLPVRVNFRGALNYPLSAYLNPINWAYWNSPDDTPRLIANLRRGIEGGAVPATSHDVRIERRASAGGIPVPYAAAQPALEMPEGTMPNESKFYVVRPVDRTALNTIALQGVTLTIKAPRQMGKSSLLIRTMAEAREQQKRVAFLDFQLIDGQALENGDTFFRQFCSWVSDALEMPDDVASYWDAPLGNSQRCTRYIQRHILPGADAPLVLAMDEVDRIFNSPFRSDFFSMLRSWHNVRATSPVWKKLDLVLVTSTEPYQLIQDLNQSPFNVGQVIELADFTAEQVSHLNQLHGSPLSKAEEGRLMTLLSGHPYLVRRALYLVANGAYTPATLLDQATDERGPFGDHLRYHIFRLHDREALIQGLRQVIRSKTCQDELIFFRLRGAGLVKREGRSVVMRCPLYLSYFQEHLHV